jgi:hypothetical protein
VFNASKIQSGLLGLVGIRQPIDPVYDRFTVAQYASKSGLFVDDVQAFRVENFVDTIPLVNPTDLNVQQKWLELEKSSISNVMARVFDRPSYLDRNIIYPNSFDRSKSLTISTDATKFYGYEIKPSIRKNTAFEIESVRFEGAGIGNITVELYHSSQLNPIQFKTIALLDDGSLQIEKLNWVVDGSGSDYKGTYFLGFRVPQTFTFAPWARNYSNSNAQANIAELDIKRMECDFPLNDLSQIIYSSESCGLNFSINVFEDYTDLIIGNKNIFASVVNLQMALSAILGSVYSNRSNRNERFSKEVVALILLQVDGQRGQGLQRIVGIRELIDGEISRLRTEIETLKEGLFIGKIYVETQC